MKILSHVTPCSTRKVMAPTTAIAVRTPSTSGFHTSRSFFESVMETRQPVHAPVPGRGIATNAQRPKNRVFVIFATFFSPRLRIHRNGLPSFSNFAKYRISFPPQTTTGGITAMFPRKEKQRMKLRLKALLVWKTLQRSLAFL